MAWLPGMSKTVMETTTSEETYFNAGTLTTFSLYFSKGEGDTFIDLFLFL